MANRQILRLVAVAAMLLACVTTVPAQDEAPWLGSYYMPGNLVFTLGGEASFRNGFGVRAVPGFEVMVAKTRPGDAFALDFGAGVRGLAGFHRFTMDYGYSVFAVAPMLSAHLGFRGLRFPGSEYLERVDLFTALGPSYSFFNTTGRWPTTRPQAGLGIASANGLNFFLTDNLAVTVSGTYFGRFGGTYRGAFATGLGILYRIGPMEELAERDPIVVPRVERPTFTGPIMYTTFVSLYWSTIAMGGFWYDDETFEEGQGVRVQYRYQQGRNTEQMEYLRALLRINPDGTRWWRFVFDTDEDLAFEALIDDDYSLLRIRYLDPGTERVEEFVPDDPRVWQQAAMEARREEASVAPTTIGSARITVTAGTFDTDVYTYEEDEYAFTWWVAENVPGRVVQLEGSSGDMDEIHGELLEILSGVRSPWGEPR